MPTPRRVLTIIAPVLAAAALIASAAAPAGAMPGRCAKQTGTILTTHGSRFWHKGATLYGCDQENSSEHITRRLGPWTPGTKVAFDANQTVAWTVRVARGSAAGPTSDRVWAASFTDGKRWLRGTPLIPAPAAAPFEDGRVQRLFADGPTAGWVTTTGEVVMADQVPIAADYAGQVGTLTQPTLVRQQLYLIGTFTGEPASTLAPSAKFALDEDSSDGETCEGTNVYDLTVVPTPGAARIGGSLAYDWVGTKDDGC